jgi:DNA polymerase-3 subunit delta'
MLSRVFDWLSGKLHAMRKAAPQQLAPFAEVWEKLANDARDCETYNLDKRPLVLALFRDLALAVRMAG